MIATAAQAPSPDRVARMTAGRAGMVRAGAFLAGQGGERREQQR